LGKIFDALEKSKEGLKEPAIIKKESPVLLAEQPDEENNRLKVDEAHIKDRNVDENLVVLLKPHSLEAEQFKMLRTNILFPVAGKPPRSIMVTSALPGEGKTFVSANLAISIALNINEHVLLVDCDFRLPEIHTRFGYGQVSGLSDYLADDAPLHSLLLRPDIHKLTILPAGRPPPNPSELLSSFRMSELLKEVKERYPDRYIIIDSPPPQLTPEASAIARQVDAILLVLRYGSTRRELTKDLIDMVGKEKLIGIVMNRFEVGPSKYYQYSKYGRYGK